MMSIAISFIDDLTVLLLYAYSMLVAWPRYAVGKNNGGIDSCQYFP